MAPRKPKTATPAPVVVAEQPGIHYLPNPLAIATQTPRTREEIALRDAVRARLTAIEAAVMAFVNEKLAEGFAPSEIDQLYAVELPLLVGYKSDGGRIRVSYDAQIVERQS
jgi:hypothetical protein